MSASSIGTALGRAALAVVPVAAVAIAGGLATAPNIPGWYAGLAKPPGTPPNGVFGPVWTVLYCLMIVAIWRILASPADRPGRKAAIGLLYGQLALNGAWSWAFFAGRNPTAGLVVIAALLAVLAATIAQTRRVDRIAALLLVPYALWVAYAAYLNAGIRVLNP